MSNFVCPDCGSEEFYSDHVAIVRRTYTVTEGRYVSEESEEVTSVDRDFDALVCECCHSQWQEHELVSDEPRECADCGFAIDEYDEHLTLCAACESEKVE